MGSSSEPVCGLQALAQIAALEESTKSDAAYLFDEQTKLDRDREELREGRRLLSVLSIETGRVQGLCCFWP